VLTDVGAAQSVSLPGLPADLSSRLFEVPEEGDPIFSAPVLRRAVLGREEAVTALILSAEPVRDSPDGSTRGLLDVHLVSDELRSAGCASADVFRVTLTLPDAPASLVGLWADGAQASRRGLVVRGTTDPLTPSCWARLKQAGQTVFANTRVVVYPSFHAPCDVYGLGMMLFRTLLVNDAQDMERGADVVTRVASRLEPMVQGQGEGSRAVLAARLRRRLEDEDGLFASDAVLYRKEDRTVESRRVVPCYLWYDALLLGFRMVSGVPEFSLCRDHGDYDRQAPHALLERVVDAAEDIDARIRLELFGSPRRNREILEACDTVRRELASMRGE
jgi:hypothetical protein